MVIVEGPDGGGKSTLVGHFRDVFGLKVGERGVANRDFLYKVTRGDTYRALSLAVHGTERPLVWDRLFVSEFVYHDINPRRPCEFSHFERDFVMEVLNALKCPVIVCLPPFDVVKENAMNAHQMDGVKNSLWRIWEAYAMGDLPWPENHIYYDYTHQIPNSATLTEVEEEIEGYITERHRRQTT